MSFDYAYSTTNQPSTGTTIFYWIVCIFMLVVMWKVFEKANKPGWAAIIPIYNVIVLIQIAGLSLWYLLLLFIPIVNIYAIFKIYIELAHKFGQSTAFGVLSVFFGIICMPILAFGKAQSVGNNTTSTNM